MRTCVLGYCSVSIKKLRVYAVHVGTKSAQSNLAAPAPVTDGQALEIDFVVAVLHDLFCQRWAVHASVRFACDIYGHSMLEMADSAANTNTIQKSFFLNSGNPLKNAFNTLWLSIAVLVSELEQLSLWTGVL